MLDALKRIKWYLWHGNGYRVHDEISDLYCDAEAIETVYPNMRKFLTAIGECATGSGERIYSAFVEATMNAVSSRCNGAGPARIFYYKPVRRPSADRCG